MFPECDITQKSAITSSLKTLRGTLPNTECVKEVSEAVCEAQKVDPECKLKEIENCEFDYDSDDYENDDDKCL
jgi:hypothetical protein